MYILIAYSPNVETLALLVKTDKFGKTSDTTTTADTTSDTKINYREEEIPDCGCIYG